jgi:NAD(P)-dependent dehydrogenase (short-subunit alcohol dehydrogenase family)/rhamnose utilization protein RhaD (predicted bifunctional aldolase and dehydrogenase)
MPSSRSDRSSKSPSSGAAKSTRKRADGGNGVSASVRSELDDLIRISREIGSDPDLAQGGGGNTSVKSADGRSMWIKASGTALVRMSADAGWAELDLAAVAAILDAPELAASEPERREADVLRRLELAVVRPRGARPSVESNLHALLDRVVIHTHPVGFNALLVSKNSAKAWRDVLGDLASRALYVPYVDPGYELARQVRIHVERFTRENGRRPAIVLLENHGVFVAAPDTAACLELHARVVAAGAKWAKVAQVNERDPAWVIEPDPRRASELANPAAAIEVKLRGALLGGGAAACVVQLDPSELAARFASNTALVAQAKRGAFTPDQIVYCRTRPLVLPRAEKDWRDAVREYRTSSGLDPRVVIVPGLCIAYAAPDLAQLRIVKEVYRSAIAAFLAGASNGGVRLLSPAATAFIESWEVEQFRARLAAGAGRRLSGRVALVTGAGSGLGKGISLGLLGAGATIIGLDVDRGALDEFALAQSPGKVVPIVCDVTSEESIAKAFSTAIATTGGIDFAVNAAGIAPSFPLVDFPLGAWRKTLEINLTGYFLIAREAARVLIAQGAGGSILNLTSKSGLDASRSNSAYNATKAGEIHLMRGWALELGRENIRVNCVAPGNVFKGSKIWNDEYIRAAAKKKGIRPEEVIPYYTSLSPLGKEIEPDDIANAVVFLFSDEARYITGQTIVVDGGQVMVR